MTTPTTAAQANDLGERCSLVIGSFGYMAKSLDRHSIWMADQPWLKITPQSSANPGAVYISSNTSLTMRDYDRFSRVVANDWRAGAGQITFTPSAQATQNRFLDSTGVDVSAEGQLKLVNAMASKYTTTSANAGLPLCVAGAYLYLGEISAVKFSTSWSGAPTSAATHTAGTVESMVSDGTYVYASINGVGIDRFAIASAAAGTNWSATFSGGPMIFANRRIYGVGSQLTEWAIATGTATNDFTLPTGYSGHDLCALRGGSIDAPIIVLAVAGLGTGTTSYQGVQTMTYYWDGTTIHDYVGLPVGFGGQRMLQYLGVIYVYGFQANPDSSVSPWAYAIVDGTLVNLGPIGVQQTNGNPTAAGVASTTSFGIAAQGRFVYFAIPTNGVSISPPKAATDIWRYDIVNGGMSRYISVTASTTDVTGDLAIFSGRPWVTVSYIAGTGGLYGSGTTYVTTGSVTQSDSNLGQPWSGNLWATIETTFAPLAAGEQVAVAYSLDAGATFVTTDASGAAMTASTLNQKSATFVISNATASNTQLAPYIRPKVTLTAGTSQLTTPTFYSLSIKALPANPAGVVLDAWLSCSDKQLQPNGQADWQGASAAERLYNIRNLYELQSLVTVIYMAPGATRAKNPITIAAVIDDYEIDYYSPSGFRPGGGDVVGVEGDVHVILREVRS